MEMPKPTEKHKKLELLAGLYTGQETLHPSPWDADGGCAEAKNACRVALDGFAVIGEFEQCREGKPNFQGHGVFTYDQQEACYKLHWFDSMGCGGSVFRGDFEGDTLKMICKDPPHQCRLEYDLSENGQMAFKMEISADGKSWQPCMEGTYARAD